MARNSNILNILSTINISGENYTDPILVNSYVLTLIHVGRGVHQISITLIGGTSTGTEIMD